ncbi:MAG: hypothetical protein ACKVPX_14390 [Myxococcaceae bacterium]
MPSPAKAMCRLHSLYGGGMGSARAVLPASSRAIAENACTPSVTGWLSKDIVNQPHWGHVVKSLSPRNCLPVVAQAFRNLKARLCFELQQYSRLEVMPTKLAD